MSYAQIEEKMEEPEERVRRLRRSIHFHLSAAITMNAQEGSFRFMQEDLEAALEYTKTLGQALAALAKLSQPKETGS